MVKTEHLRMGENVVENVNVGWGEQIKRECRCLKF